MIFSPENESNIFPNMMRLLDSFGRILFLCILYPHAVKITDGERRFINLNGHELRFRDGIFAPIIAFIRNNIEHLIVGKDWDIFLMNIAFPKLSLSQCNRHNRTLGLGLWNARYAHREFLKCPGVDSPSLHR